MLDGLERKVRCLFVGGEVCLLVCLFGWLFGCLVVWLLFVCFFVCFFVCVRNNQIGRSDLKVVFALFCFLFVCLNLFVCLLVLLV